MTPVFIIILTAAIAMYVYYKVKAVRTKTHAYKRWVQAKANISLGLFMAAFGANLLQLVRGPVDIIVGVVFLLVGAANIVFGWRAFRIHGPYAAEEAQNQRPGNQKQGRS
ncbi:YtpI family protein [Salibacterium lacus]|uniref:YtpI family protein n=1 Tax=Salibacterium lacus TaxID=1898109 RepID=A0ABW5T350_9BACI